MKKKSAKEVYTLTDLQRWENIDPPIRLGVFGDPVGHSLSPQMQNAALKSCKIDMQYARFQISPDELQSALDLIRELNFVGVNLTTPHKIGASKLMDEIDDNARRIGAINTVRVDNAKLCGHNTNRNFATAQKLAEELREYFAGPRVLGPVPRLLAIPWEEAAIRFQIAHLDLIVNATLLGLNRSDPSPIPARLLAPHLMVYDTVYREGRTPFVAAAIEAGARAANGFSMLLYQGALAFEIWFEREAPIEAMRKALM